ncbi:SDR family NAD(P)-dependent oxidoreductase [Catenovulum sediminis]|uniref:SDR family NAD(P)-dependent oxidoreductase n=1 Tax=Catenovulum sediminis TaxID=1740262 RepID=A0ABV1RGU8_9ALTE
MQQDKSILIVGATGGIGSHTAKALAKQGYGLIISARNLDKLESLKAELLQLGAAGVECFVLDLQDSSAIKGLFQFIQKQVKHLYGLVNCAGTLHESPLMMIRPDDIQAQVNLHLTSSILLAQYASRLMVRNKQGVIVFLSSVVAAQGASGQALYAACKSSLFGLTKSLAKELGGQNIRVNLIEPGFIETELVAHYSDEQRAELKQQTALKSLGQADDVAQLISFLISSKARYITAQNIAVDGGLALS